MSVPFPQPSIEADPEFMAHPFLAEGGEHRVFMYGGTNDIKLSVLQDLPLSSDTVLKFVLGELVACNAGIEPPYLVESWRIATAHAAERNKRYARLAQVFGRHTLGQLSQPMYVTLGEQTAAKLHPFAPHVSKGSQVSIVATFQPLVRDLLLPAAERKTTSLHLPYVEYGEVESSCYARITDKWLTNPTPPTDKEIEEFTALYSDSPLRHFLYRSSIKRLASLGDYTEDAIQYSRLTREILDIAGPDNVIFGDDYLLVDALFPSSCQHIDLVPSIIKRVQAGWGLSHREKITLLNGLGYMRVMNFLAALFELPERIDSMIGSAIHEQTWKNVHTALSTLPRPHMLNGPTQIYRSKTE